MDVMELLESMVWVAMGFGPTIAGLLLATKAFPEQLELKRTRRESVGGLRVDV